MLICCLPAADVHDKCNGGRRGGDGLTRTSSPRLRHDTDGSASAAQTSSQLLQDADGSASAAAAGGTAETTKRRRGPVVLYDHGYVASPNYPTNYFNSALHPSWVFALLEGVKGWNV